MAPYTQYLAIGNHQSIDWINRPNQQQALQPNLHHSSFIGQDTDKGYWLKINLEHIANVHPRPEQMIVHIPIAANLIYQLDFYEPTSDDDYRVIKTGRSRPWHSRDLKVNEYAFLITLRKETPHFYLHVRNNQMGFPISLPMYLYNTTSFTEPASNLKVLKAAFYSIMLAFLAYNFCLYGVLRERMYLYYTLVLAGQMFLAGCTDASLFYQLWPNNPELDVMAAVCAGILVNIFRLPYIYLNLNSHQKTQTYPIYSLFVLIGILILAFVFATNLIFGFRAFHIQTSQLYAAICLVFVLFMIARAIIKGNRIAIYFLVAEVLLIAGTTIFMLAINGHIPHSLVTFWSLNAGYLCEVILFSLAMAARTRSLRQEKEELQAKALLAAEHSNQLKSNFMATISHELRTPMNGVLGNLELLHQRRIPANVSKNIHDIDQSAEDMMVLIDRLLQFSEVQAGSVKVQKVPFHLREELTPLLNRYHNRCAIKGLDFHVEIPAALPSWLKGDIKKLIYILDNLLENALKFTESGFIRFQVQQLTNDHWRFLIVDTGVGIQQDQLNEIFEAFHQLDGSYSRQHQGIGLGLAICQHLADLLEGKIDVRSSPAAGSQFSLELTLEQLNMGAEQFLYQAHEPATILVAEDNVTNQLLLKNMVEKQGHQVVTANNGQEAIEAIQRGKVDLVLMDCQMPLINGFEATREIRQLSHSVPIIAVTANALSDDREKCINAGMDDYLSKPVRYKQVSSMISQWLSYNQRHHHYHQNKSQN